MDTWTIMHNGTVTIDGDSRGPLKYDLDPTIHAVMGHDDLIEIEYKTIPFKNQRLKPRNEFTEDSKQFQSAFDAWEAKGPAPQPPPPVPPNVEAMPTPIITSPPTPESEP